MTASMLALVLQKGFDLAVVDIDTPRPAEDELLVRVESAGICGSDVHAVAARSPRRRPPLVMGHEIVGEVVEAGGRVGETLVGAFVAVNPQVPCGWCPHCRSGRENVCPNRELIGGTRSGGFAEYVCVPTRCAHPIHQTAPAVAVFAEPLATCVHALGLAPPRLGVTAAVIGAGTIGVLAAQVVRLAGASTIVLCDSDEARRAEATSVADVVVPPEDLAPTIHELTHGVGAGMTIDAVGVEAARRQSLDLLEVGGTALWLGMHSQDASLSGFDIVVREQRVQGSFAYTDAEFAAALRLLEARIIEPAVTHRPISLQESADVFQDLILGEWRAASKAVVSPQRETQPLTTGSR